MVGRLYVQYAKHANVKVATAGAMSIMSYFVLKVSDNAPLKLTGQYALEHMDPNRQKKQDAKKVSETKLGKLGVNRKDIKLNEYEGM